MGFVIVKGLIALGAFEVPHDPAVLDDETSSVATRRRRTRNADGL